MLYMHVPDYEYFTVVHNVSLIGELEERDSFIHGSTNILDLCLVFNV